jgi:protein O-GlcNAc transferase
MVSDGLARIRELLLAGDVAKAEVICETLLQQFAGDYRAWQAAGVVAMSRGNFGAAEKAFLHSVGLEPNGAESWNALSAALLAQQRAAEAENCAGRAVAIDPANAEYWCTLGNARYLQKRCADASEAYRQAVTLDPTLAQAWSNLGASEHFLKRYAAAEEAYERCLSLDPQNLDALTNLASLLCERGQAERALEYAAAVAATASHAADGWFVKGRACLALRRFAEAEAAFRRVLEMSPNHLQSKHNLAVALWRQGRLTEAEQWTRQLLGEDENHAEVWRLLGTILQLRGRANEAVEALRRSVEIGPHAGRHSKLLMALQYVEGVSPESLLVAHQQWNAAYAPKREPTDMATYRKSGAGDVLRIGFFSDAFCNSPIGMMVLGVLAQLDTSRCTIVCYSDRIAADEYTARFRAVADDWRITAGLETEEVVELIRGDEVDVLVDLMGHSGDRLSVFAEKPAKLQMSWFGYVGTTGLGTMDYLLADRFHVREGEERWYTERVLRMPHGYACYQAPSYAPEVGPLPALASGRVTFGCFNAPGKYSSGMFDAWAEILKRAPDARLLLKYMGLHEAETKEFWQGELVRRGVEKERLVCEGFSTHRDMLTAYQRVDIALDTQPYSGGVTTCEALWMGVPVITFPGRTFAGRHATSHLSNAGYPQFIADDAQGYVGLAVLWSRRLDDLTEIRGQMREQVSRSPLCNAARFASDFLEVLRRA